MLYSTRKQSANSNVKSNDAIIRPNAIHNFPTLSSLAHFLAPQNLVTAGTTTFLKSIAWGAKRYTFGTIWYPFWELGFPWETRYKPLRQMQR